MRNILPMAKLLYKTIKNTSTRYILFNSSVIILSIDYSYKTSI